MIEYKKRTLANGLTVVVNRDKASKLAAVNILYKVGARNENPARTGFAHLFEHLMFRGTREIPNFDLPVQMACGDNNAFTNNDYTDFYITLPKDNIETALWLESDRMEGLDITPEKLEAEKRVVIEEFRQRYLNQPYGDQPMLLRALAYKVHPYRWATIGLTPDHIAGATLDDVQAFYRTHYHPSNAILSVSADFDEERMLDLAEKWFAPLADRTVTPQPIPGNRSRRRPAGRRSNATCPPRPCRWHSTWAAAPRRISIPPTWSPTSCRARLVASLQTPGAGTAPAGLGQRLHFGRRRPGVVRLYGATAAGYHSRTGRSGFPCRNRGIAERPGIGLRGREGQKQVRG